MHCSKHTPGLQHSFSCYAQPCICLRAAKPSVHIRMGQAHPHTRAVHDAEAGAAGAACCAFGPALQAVPGVLQHAALRPLHVSTRWAGSVLADQVPQTDTSSPRGSGPAGPGRRLESWAWSHPRGTCRRRTCRGWSTRCTACPGRGHSGRPGRHNRPRLRLGGQGAGRHWWVCLLEVTAGRHGTRAEQGALQ